MKLLLAFLMLALLPVAPARVFAQEATSTVAEAGLFTYQAPPGWKVSNSPSSKYPVCMGAPKDAFAPNINVVREEFDGTLAEYVAANKKALSTTPVFSKMKFVDEKPFVTTSGAKGVALSTASTMGKLDLGQTFYFFDGPTGAKLVVTCSALAKDRAAHAAKFETSMKTFSVTK